MRLRSWLAAIAVIAMVTGLTGSFNTTGIAEAASSNTAKSKNTKEDPNAYDEGTIFGIADGFFGQSSKALGKVIQKAFADLGRPNAYIVGDEVSGAIAVGLRYGDGTITNKTEGTRRVYWKGPSAGFDLGGNASKTFTLVYHLDKLDDIYHRFPGVDGSVYYIAGVSMNYQQRGHVILAPIRVGVGLRLGANVGYLHYTRKRSWIPF
jgi:hypothetical protein